jgi:acyl-CoA dehydrogenase
MLSVLWFLAFFAAVLWLAYTRRSLATATLTLGALLVAYTCSARRPVWKSRAVGGLRAARAPQRALRVRFLTRPFLRTYKRLLPPMSSTEREALEAGTVWWDGELFTGSPDWKKLSTPQAPQLTTEEKAFLDGPCDELCRLVDEWDITHRRADLSPDVWDFSRRRASSR